MLEKIISYNIYDDIEKIRLLLQKRYSYRQPLAYTHTFGCQQNVSDSEKINGMLALMGYGFCDTPEQADLVLFNTCAVRENAEDRVFGTVGALKSIKRNNPSMLLCICGCMVQQKHIVEKIKKSYPYVDLVMGTHLLKEFPILLYKVLSEEKNVIDISENDLSIAEGLPIKRESSLKAWLPIMYGCNNFCTYCIVPFVRGREISRKSEDIINEFTSLIKSGYKEITLLGQNVNSYGKGLDENINFAGILRKLNAIQGDFRIRFMTSNPRDATFELIDTIADCKKVCRHFHLPVQSGSDKILSLMNRKYTTADYYRLIDYARKKIPEITFTSDIIVGFPGETQADFEETISLIKKVKFDSLYSFIYSKRVGTKAALIKDDTPYKIKSARFQHLLDVQKKIGAEKYQTYVGQAFRVLIDKKGKLPGQLSGRTSGNMIVNFSGDLNQIGQFATVKITQAFNSSLVGELIK